ncbi:hypothetical protein N7493_007868 [Penicillium malachiteum]|uniref:Uncharacterized protein n=1 Tax=Penicillium malachiteum TaxID=1324776 RepID=A0AAD6HJ78_9EURO|nr:hypothetical protein N7493_007868 [Penicillium malachiteum]
MRKREDNAIRKNNPAEDKRLSSRMRASWQSGDFWIMYAARNNFAFDTIYWKKIDQRFFGATTCGDDDFSEAWRERLNLLDPSERELMEECVSLKIKERYDRLLAWDLDEYGIEWTERTRAIVQRERARIKRQKEERGREEKEREEKQAEEENGYPDDAEGVNAEKEELDEMYAKLQVSGAVEHSQEGNWS